MEIGFDRRLGLGGLVVGVIGVGITILWPDAKWLGWLFLLAAGIILCIWSALEAVQLLGRSQFALAVSLVSSLIIMGVLYFAHRKWGHGAKEVAAETSPRASSPVLSPVAPTAPSASSPVSTVSAPPKPNSPAPTANNGGGVVKGGLKVEPCSSVQVGGIGNISTVNCNIYPSPAQTPTVIQSTQSGNTITLLTNNQINSASLVMKFDAEVSLASKVSDSVGTCMKCGDGTLNGEDGQPDRRTIWLFWAFPAFTPDTPISFKFSSSGPAKLLSVSKGPPNPMDKQQ